MTDFFGRIYTGCTTAAELFSFVQGGRMVEVLNAVGDVHYAAAIRALEDAKASASPHREIGMAAASLRVAYEAFHTSARSPWRWLGVATIVGMPFAYNGFANAYRSESEAAIAAACCYAALRESAVTALFVERAQVAFDKHLEWRASAEMGSAGGSVSPADTYEIFSKSRVDDEEAFAKLCANLVAGSR